MAKVLRDTISFVHKLFDIRSDEEQVHAGGVLKTRSNDIYALVTVDHLINTKLVAIGERYPAGHQEDSPVKQLTDKERN